MDRAFEWGSYSLWSFVGAWSYLLSPWFWRLIFDLVRFSYFAIDILSEQTCAAKNSPFSDLAACQVQHLGATSNDERLESIGHYLRRQQYSEQFIKLVLIPMVAAPWCIDPESFSCSFPAKPLIHFM